MPSRIAFLGTAAAAPRTLDFLRQLITTLASRTTVDVLIDGAGPLSVATAALGVPAEIISVPGPVRGAARRAARERVERWSAARRPDVIYVASAALARLVRTTSQALRVRRIAHVLDAHGWHRGWGKVDWRAGYDSWVLEHSRLGSILGKETVTTIHAASGLPRLCIAAGARPRLSDRRRMMVGSWAGPGRDAGAQEFQQAVQRMNRPGSPAVYLSRQDGAVGEAPDRRAFLATLDILVVTDRTPLEDQLILEAMAQGVTVVASHAPGSESLLTSGRDGWLVPPRDPRALERALRLLVRTPRVCWALGEQARRRVRRELCRERSLRRVVAHVLGLPARPSQRQGATLDAATASC